MVAVTRTLNAGMIVSATKANAVSKGVAFETVVVATQVSVEMTTTVVMDNGVTSKAADKTAAKIERVRMDSDVKVLDLIATSALMADRRLFWSTLG